MERGHAWVAARQTIGMCETVVNVLDLISIDRECSPSVQGHLSTKQCAENVPNSVSRKRRYVHVDALRELYVPGFAAVTGVDEQGSLSKIYDERIMILSSVTRPASSM